MHKAGIVLTQIAGSVGKNLALGMAVVLVMGGCATSKIPAPVEDRMAGAKAAAAPVAAASAVTATAVAAAASAPAETKPVAPPLVVEPPKPLPGAENAGKPGYYTIKPGDTIIRIGLETGQNWKDLVKWNNLDNPNIVEVGQVLRVIPPGSDAGAATRPVAGAKVCLPGQQSSSIGNHRRPRKYPPSL